MLDTLDKYSYADLRDCEMIAVAVLTHGEDNGILMASDHFMNIEDFIEPIKLNPTLIGKPKVYSSFHHIETKRRSFVPSLNFSQSPIMGLIDWPNMTSGQIGAPCSHQDIESSGT